MGLELDERCAAGFIQPSSARRAADAVCSFLCCTGLTAAEAVGLFGLKTQRDVDLLQPNLAGCFFSRLRVEIFQVKSIAGSYNSLHKLCMRVGQNTM